jgi:hypothetical protein
MRTTQETFSAICTHTNKVLCSAFTAKAAMELADKAKPVGGVIVRGEFTSDGSHWGPAQGRVVAAREYGRWSIG